MTKIKSHHSRGLRFLTATELRQLLASAAALGCRDYCMILIAYRHGLRASEVCRMDSESVDLAAGRIVCRRLKGSVTNWQRLAVDEVSALREWLKARPETGSRALFVDDDGNEFSRFQLYRMFRRHALAAGIPVEKCHPHVLKHSLGTHLANAGVPVQVIQQRLGHRCISNTMVYLQIASAYVDRAVAEAIDAGAVV